MVGWLYNYRFYHTTCRFKGFYMFFELTKNANSDYKRWLLITDHLWGLCMTKRSELRKCQVWVSGDPLACGSLLVLHGQVTQPLWCQTKQKNSSQLIKKYVKLSKSDSQISQTLVDSTPSFSMFLLLLNHFGPPQARLPPLRKVGMTFLGNESSAEAPPPLGTMFLLMHDPWFFCG